MTDFLKLLPNPYVFIDAKGRAAGTHPMRPDPHAGGHQKVGAVVASSVVAKKNPMGGPGTGNTPITQDTEWEHSSEPFQVENSADGFYVRAVMVGDLFAADKATADALGLKFQDPYQLLQAAREKAIATWTANHGSPPAFASEACPVAGKRKPVTLPAPPMSAKSEVKS